MTNANAVTFARTSYVLAGVASGVVFLSILFNFVPDPTISTILTQLCWVTLPVTAVGTFMGFTARSTIKDQVNTDDNPPDIWKKAKNGAILNAVLLGVTLVGAVIRIITTLINLI